MKRSAPREFGAEGMETVKKLPMEKEKETRKMEREQRFE